ncbi:hypothetical protein, partial [uncultured Pseudacidovorax sp.]|uniref:hypothetical protein n=1 Tax=uncultured Pseudacidovorax sp. TaxID=679313 RepID=UPI0025EFCBAE
ESSTGAPSSVVFTAISEALYYDSVLKDLSTFRVFRGSQRTSHSINPSTRNSQSAALRRALDYDTLF